MKEDFHAGARAQQKNTIGYEKLRLDDIDFF